MRKASPRDAASWMRWMNVSTVTAASYARIARIRSCRGVNFFESGPDEIDRQPRHVDTRHQHVARQRQRTNLFGGPTVPRARDEQGLQVLAAETRHRRAAHRQRDLLQDLPGGRELHEPLAF